jgi:hypothetical protein
VTWFALARNLVLVAMFLVVALPLLRSMRRPAFAWASWRRASATP